MPLLRIFYYKIHFHHLISIVSHCYIATLMVVEFYLLKRCASTQFHKFDSLISFHAQADYGSELVEDCHNTICTLDMIHIPQEYAHTTRLLEQYL